MPGSMDERIVSMEFDNKQFEKNVKTSMRTIDDLKKSLDFDKTGESLDDISDKFKKIGKENVFKNLDESVDSLRLGLYKAGDSAQGMIKQFAEITKITAMVDLARSAIAGLERQIKKFTIQPISSGLQKYETKISSIKTISNATGMSADAVNESLDRLNWFTDETSASFEQMVQNIGKFTSVGKQLDESITAMEGIAAWGYHSGASVAEQTRAMYNLSQALGTGSVKLIDWKSIENAGMATKEFKEQAIAAAEAAGELKRKGDKLFTKKGNKQVTVENFNSTLAQGWFTSDVLMATLKEYGGFADEVKSYMEKHPAISLASDAMEAMDLERLNDRLGVFSSNLDSLAKNAGLNAKDLQEELKAIQDYANSDDVDYDELEEKIKVFAKRLKIDMNEVVRINKIADPKAREKEIKAWAKTIGIDATEATKILEKLAKTEETLGEKAFKSSQQAKTFTEAVDATLDAVSTGWMNTFQTIFGGLEDSIALWSDLTEILWDLFAAGADSRNNWLTHWAEEFAGRDDLWGKDGIMHSIMDTIIELKNLLGSTFKDVFFPGLKNALGNFGDDKEEYRAIKDIQNGLLTVDQLRYRKEGSYMGKQLKDITTAVKNFGLAIKNFVKDNMANFETIFRAAANVLRFFGDVIGHVFSTLGRFISESGVAQDILNLATRIAAKITEIVQKINESGFVTKVFTKIGNGLIWFYNVLKKWIGQISSFLEKSGLAQMVRDYFTRISEYFLGGADDVDENGNKTESKFFRAFGWVKKVKDFIDGIDLEAGLFKIKDFIDNFGEIWAAFTVALGGGKLDKKGLKDSGLSDSAQGMVAGAWSFGSKLSGVFNFIKGLYEKIKSWVSTAWNWITTMFGKIKLFVSNFGEIWSAFTVALGGGKLDKKGLKDSGLSEDLQNMIEGAWNFGNKLSGVVNFIKRIYNSVVGWLESSGILPGIRSLWEGIKTFFGNIGLIWDVFVKGKKVDPKDLDEKQMGLIDGIKNFLSQIQSVWEKVKGWFNSAWTWITEKWGMFTDWLENSGILPKIREIWGKVKTVIGNFGEIWSAFTVALGGGKLDKKALKNSGLDEGLQGAITGAFGFGERIRGIVESIKGAWDGVKGWLEDSGILPTLRSWWDGITKWFEEVAKSIQENGVFKAVSDFFANLWDMITGLFGGADSPTASVTDALPMNGSSGGEKKQSILDKIFGGFINDEGNFDLITGISNGIVGLMKQIASIDWTGIASNVFGVMVQVINGFNDALGKLEIGNILKVIGEVVGMFKGVMIISLISNVVSTVKSFVKKGKDKSAIEQFTDLLKAIGEALLQLGIAVALVAASMWLISKIDPTRFDAVTNVLIGIGAFFIIFIAVVAIITKVMGKDGNKLAKTMEAIGKMFLNIALSVAIMVAAIWLISLMLDENGKMSDRMHNALIIVAQIVGFIAVIVVAMAGLTKLIGSKVDIAISIATFAGIAILLGVMVVAILLLQNVDPGKAWGVILELGGMMLAVGLLMKSLGKINRFNPKMIVGLITMAVMLGMFVAAFFLLKDADPTTLAVIAGSIVGVLNGMAAAMLIMAKVPPAALKGVAIVSAGILILVTALAAAAWVIAQVASSVMGNFVTAMSLYAAGSKSAAMVDKDAIMNALELLPEIAEAFATMQNMSFSVAYAIGVAEAAWTVFSKLHTATKSAQLVDEKQFYKIFGEDGKGGILNIIQTGLSGITDTGFKAAILGTHVEQLSESLKLVGQAGLMLDKELEDYGNETYTQGIQNVKDRLTDIQTIVQMATDMSTIGEDGTVSEDFLTKFSEGIANIGAALQLYNTALASFETEGGNGTEGINATDVAPIDTASISAALTSVMEILKTATFDEGQIGEIEKWASIDKSGDGGTLFALGLTNIANAMGTFSTAAADFNNGNVDKAIESLGILAEIKSKVENPADYDGVITGVTAWGDSGTPEHKGSFANAISSMGTALAAFGESVKDIPYTAVFCATIALKTLAALYEQLNGNEKMISYFGAGALLQALTGGGGQSIEEVFTDFGTGIEKLGAALMAFSESISSKESGYDPEKVKSAIGILQALTDLETQLKTIDVSGNFWHDILFGENGLKKLGEHITGVGTELSTFSGGLAEFNIDIDSTLWKNVSGVLSYMAELWNQINAVNQEIVSSDVANSGVSTTTVLQKSSYTLSDLATGLKDICGAMIEFSTAMADVRAVNGVNNKTFQLGDWSSSNYEALTSMISFFKDISIDLKNAGLESGGFYDLTKFGNDLQNMFNSLDDSKAGDFIGKLESFSSLTEVLQKFSDSNGEVLNAKGLAMAAEFLNGFGSRLTLTESTDGGLTLASICDSFVALINQIFGVDDLYAEGKAAGEKYASGFGQNGQDGMPTLFNNIFSNIFTKMKEFEGDFLASGKNHGNKYIEGFKLMTGGVIGIGQYSGFQKTIEDLVTASLFDDEKYRTQGQTAGEQYAAGFKEGLKNGGLEPIISVGADGKVSTNGTAEPTILDYMMTYGIPKSADITELSTRLDSINDRFNSAINVDDSHTEVLAGISTKLDKLDRLASIEENVGALQTEVNNLKVYIYPNELVGAIAPFMDRRLGMLANKNP